MKSEPGERIDLGELFSLYTGSLGKGHKLLLAAGALCLILLVLLARGGLRRGDADAMCYLCKDVSDRHRIVAIAEELERAKIPFSIADSGRSLLVPRASLMKAVSVVMQSKRERGGELTMGQTLFPSGLAGLGGYAERLRLQEEELAETISMFEAVESARVHITLPDDSIFKGSDVHPSVSVLVRLKDGFELEPQMVFSITELITHSVQGMKPEYVSISDLQGRNYTPVIANRKALLAAMSTRVKRMIEDDLAARIHSQLAWLFGKERVRVEVAVELDAEVAPLMLRQGAWSMLGLRGVPASARGVPAGGGRRGLSRFYSFISRLAVKVRFDRSLIKGEGVGEGLRSAVRRCVAAVVDFDPRRGDSLELELASLAPREVSSCAGETDDEEPSAARPLLSARGLMRSCSIPRSAGNGAAVRASLLQRMAALVGKRGFLLWGVALGAAMLLVLAVAAALLRDAGEEREILPMYHPECFTPSVGEFVSHCPPDDTAPSAGDGGPAADTGLLRRNPAASFDEDSF